MITSRRVGKCRYIVALPRPARRAMSSSGASTPWSWKTSMAVATSRYTSWSRWVTLVVLAHVFLALAPADEHTRPHPMPSFCSSATRSSVKILVVRPVHGTAHRPDWSVWRRRHQAGPRAATHHDVDHLHLMAAAAAEQTCGPPSLRHRPCAGSPGRFSRASGRRQGAPDRAGLLPPAGGPPPRTRGQRSPDTSADERTDLPSPLPDDALPAAGRPGLDVRCPGAIWDKSSSAAA